MTVTCTCRIYALEFGQYWTLPCVGGSSAPNTPSLCGCCSSGRDFARRALLSSASGFLQIPSRGGHPCLRLTVPTAKSVVNFHHLVISHVGRT